MNRIIRAFAAFIVSICLILAPSIQYANAASSWSITGAVSAGSRTIVSATKGGYKSAVNIAPSAGRLAIKLGKGANWAALVYAAVQLAPDLADIESFQPDYSNNKINYKHKIPAGTSFYTVAWGTTNTAAFPTKEQACQAFGALEYGSQYVSFHSIIGDNCTLKLKINGVEGYYQVGWVRPAQPVAETGSVSISAAAARVLSNAANGHAASQEAVRQTTIEMVIGGQFDRDLLAGAVPISDTRPLVPSVPISGNGNVTHGSDVGIGDDGMSGATPGQQSDAATDAADAARKAAQAAADAAKAAAEDARRAADDAADLVNSGADTAAIDAANDRAAAAEQAAADTKAAADAAVAAANDRAVAAERAAEAATQAAQAAATQAAADVAAAQASGDAAAIAAAEAAKAAADAAVADAKAKQAAAEKAAEKAKAEAQKPFELPPFCSWATPVCDFIDWVKADPQLEEPEDTRPEIQDLTKYDTVDISQNYITATGQCPPAADLNINFGVVKLSYEPLCIILDKLSGVIVAVAYISVGFMIIRTV